MIKVSNQTVFVSTKTLDAILENGAILSLKDKFGNEYISMNEKETRGIDILYKKNETVPILRTDVGRVYTYLISDHCVQIKYDAWDGNALILISEDLESGDLIIEPEVTSARYGVMAARYYIDGISKGYRMVAPFFQGVDLELEDELIYRKKWRWPAEWEASIVIFHNTENGFYVWNDDNTYRPKSLTCGGYQSARGLMLDAETYGPLDHSTAAGGLSWRINVFKGTWRVPALRYRDWYRNAYHLLPKISSRASWFNDVKMGVTWCPTNMEIVNAIAKKVDPHKVILHLSEWREKPYDQYYPDYTPSEKFIEFFEYANALGFHCMPHANSVDLDPMVPEYRYFQDYICRGLEKGERLGWAYCGKIIDVPSSNKALGESRSMNTMVKVHPGLALWRATLAEGIKNGLDHLKGPKEAIFVDVTLHSYNLENSLIDNTTSMEGMNKLIEHISSLYGGLAVGGEGLNEVTAQNLSFAQAHLFYSYHVSIDGLERCGGSNCAINALLFEGLTKTMGYANIQGFDENQLMRARIHEDHGCMPTLQVRDPKQITEPNDYVKQVFEKVNSL